MRWACRWAPCDGPRDGESGCCVCCRCGAAATVLATTLLTSTRAAPAALCAAPQLARAPRGAASQGAPARGPGAAGSTQGRRFPSNIAADNFAFFLACPSLVYETSFPRAEGAVRWAVVRRKLCWCFAAMLAVYALLTQFTLPVLRDTARGRSHADASSSEFWLVSMMRLAVPSMLMWLCGFMALFHCGLGASAEVLRFADRQVSGCCCSCYLSTCLLRVFVCSSLNPPGDFRRSARVQNLSFTASGGILPRWATFGASGTAPCMSGVYAMSTSKAGCTAGWASCLR